MISSKTMTSIFFIIVSLCLISSLVVGILFMFGVLNFESFWYTILSSLFTGLVISMISVLHSKLFRESEELEES